MVPAELPRRLVARAIDVVGVAALGGGLGAAMGFGFDWLIAAAAIVLVYFAGFDAAVGGTPGKLVLGLRVVGPGGDRPSTWQALRRESFTLLGAIPFVGPLLAIAAWVLIALSIRASPLRQGKHDLLAGGTRVIRSGRVTEG